MESPSTVDRKHPSFGCKQAIFAFGVFSGGVIKEILLVEATNTWAVMTIEEILVKDGKVNPNTSIMAIFRDCPDAGIRSELVRHVPYVDFITETVEPGRFLDHMTIAYSVRNSLNDEERGYVANKLASMVERDHKALPESSVVDTHGEEIHASKLGRLQSGLVGLGFKRNRIASWLNSVDSVELETSDFSSLLRKGVVSLSA